MSEQTGRTRSVAMTAQVVLCVCCMAVAAVFGLIALRQRSRTPDATPWEARVETLRKQVADVSAANAELSAKADDLDRKLQAAQAETAQVKAELEVERKAKDPLRDQLLKRDQAVEAARKETEAHKTQIAGFADRAAKAEKAAADLTAQLGKVTARIKELEAAAAGVADAAKKQAEAAKAQLDAQARNAQELAKQIEAAKNAAADGVKLQAALAAETAKLQQAVAAQKAAEDKAAGLQKGLADAQKAAADARQETARGQEKLKNAEAEMAALNKKLASATAAAKAGNLAEALKALGEGPKP
jgi:chromosome segregation ATPase